MSDISDDFQRITELLSDFDPQKMWDDINKFFDDSDYDNLSTRYGKALHQGMRIQQDNALADEQFRRSRGHGFGIAPDVSQQVELIPTPYCDYCKTLFIAFHHNCPNQEAS